MKAKKIICHSSDGTMLDLVVEHELTNTVVNHQEKVISPEKDVAFLKRYSDGSYSYGIIQGDYRSFGHSKGYIWSSRPSVMNQIFDSNIMEVSVEIPGCISRISRAFEISTIKAILPKGWEIIESCYDDGEKYYRIKYAGNIPLDFDCSKVMWSDDSDKSMDSEPTLNLTTILQDV